MITLKTKPRLFGVSLRIMRLRSAGLSLVAALLLGALQVQALAQTQTTLQSSADAAAAKIITAVKVNDASAVKTLALQTSNINAQEAAFPNNTALHWAVWENATQALEVLLSQPKIEVDTVNSVNETPLMIAALHGNLAMIVRLLKADAYPAKPGWTALHYAATNGHVEAMKLLLEAHAYIDAESPNKTTPLMMAARSGQILAVKYLLDEGADATLKNSQGWSAVEFAESVKATDIALGLKSRVAKLKARETVQP